MASPSTWLPVPRRDPRKSPQAGDQVQVGTEGGPRIVVLVDPDGVVWRYLGGARRPTLGLTAWQRETEEARVVVVA